LEKENPFRINGQEMAVVNGCPRSEIKIFSGGIMSEKYISNLDSAVSAQRALSAAVRKFVTRSKA